MRSPVEGYPQTALQQKTEGRKEGRKDRWVHISLT